MQKLCDFDTQWKMHIWNEIRPHSFQASALWYLIIMTWKWLSLKVLFLAMIRTALDESGMLFIFFNWSMWLDLFFKSWMNESDTYKNTLKMFWAMYKKRFCRLLSAGCHICPLVFWWMVLVFTSWVQPEFKITRTRGDLRHHLVQSPFDRGGDWSSWADVTCQVTL